MPSYYVLIRISCCEVMAREDPCQKHFTRGEYWKENQVCYKSELINVKLVMMIPFQAEGGWKVGGRFHLAGKKQIVGLTSGQALYTI